jgi:very-short-patch-repair endonuclease
MPKGLQGFQKGHKCFVKEYKKGVHHSPATEFKKGQKRSPNAGMKKGYKQKPEHTAKIIASLMGKHLSKKHLQSLRVPRPGAGIYKHKPHTEEWKIKMRKWHTENPANIFKDTKIELKVEKELLTRKINYLKQTPLCGVARVDFYLPEYKIVIQCDGDYWHGCPKHFKNNNKRKPDKEERQNKILKENGYKIFRFWECEINKSVENCINKINL